MLLDCQTERLPVNQAAGLPDREVAIILGCWVAQMDRLPKNLVVGLPDGEIVNKSGCWVAR
jgi:hypothetical protein